MITGEAVSTPDDSLGPWAVEVVEGFTHYRHPAAAASADRAPVLLLNGCAVPAAPWQPVIASLPERDVLAMDRPGYAGTDWDGRIPDLASETEAVRRIIAGPGRGRAHIVVAHSMASFRAEALALLHPDLVAGVVLVDPSLEDYRNPGPAARCVRGAWLSAVFATLGHAPIRHLLAGGLHRGFQTETVSREALDPRIFREPFRHTETLESALAEWLSYRRQAAQLTALRSGWQALTVPVVTLFSPPWPERRRAILVASQLRPRQQARLAESGHLVMIDRPDAIVAAIEELDAGA